MILFYSIDREMTILLWLIMKWIFRNTVLLMIIETSIIIDTMIYDEYYDLFSIIQNIRKYWSLTNDYSIWLKAIRNINDINTIVMKWQRN